MTKKRGKVEAVADSIFLGSKIIPDGDCSREIKRPLLLERKAMKNLKVKVTQLCPTLCNPMDSRETLDGVLKVKTSLC